VGKIGLLSINIFFKATEKINERLTNVKNVENKDKLKKIIEGCLRNDRRSQEELFKLFYGKMLPVCMRYMPDRDTAQEVLQEGFIKVFEKLGAFDFKGSFEGWIRRIIANTAIDAIRKSKRDPYLTDNDNDFKLGASDPMVEREEAEFTDLKAEIAMEAIQKLSPAYRTVFNLFVLEDYSHKEIAELLGISEGTSKSNLAKAKMNLQKIVNKKFMNIE
jgi:RNA polymerase sigma-70 factor (ECF subfamily)